MDGLSTSNLVLLDVKTNKGAVRFRDLQRVLKNSLPLGASLADLTVNDSFQSPLAQVADLLTGCVTAAWCGLKPSGQGSVSQVSRRSRRNMSDISAPIGQSVKNRDLQALRMSKSRSWRPWI